MIRSGGDYRAEWRALTPRTTAVAERRESGDFFVLA
jgi:hypothetical protein